MNQIDLKRISTPITTGIPHKSPQDVADSVSVRSFKAIYRITGQLQRCEFFPGTR